MSVAMMERSALHELVRRLPPDQRTIVLSLANRP